MRQSFRVIDTDTHVNPTLDVLLRYADQALRECLDELKPYMRTVKPRPGQGDAEGQDTATILSIRPLRYQRVAGEKPAAATEAGGERGFLSGRTHMATRLPITARVAEDNARGRLQDMDTEGRDIDFIIPGTWAFGAPALPPHLTSSLSERKLDALFMAGFLPKTGNYALISAHLGAKVGPLSNELCSLRQAARGARKKS